MRSRLLVRVFALLIINPLLAVGQEKVLYNFALNGDGNDPVAQLVFDKNGNLYGTTFAGGQHECGYDFGCGTIFQLTPGGKGQWKETVLHDFTGGEDSCSPFGNLIFDASGNLYGTASGAGDVDGPCNGGAIFELSPGPNDTWTYKALYSFAGESDGAFPNGIIFDDTGNLYGTTGAGGSNNGGTVFELSPQNDGSWSEKVLASFSYQGQFGFLPVGGVVLDKQGNLYGITCCGGAYGYSCSPNDDGCGVVFELTLNKANGEWTKKILHNFNYTDGANAAGALTLDAAGNLYGTTSWGGVFGKDCGSVRCGIVFELSPEPNGNWKEKVLHYFSSILEDGNNPAGQLIFDAAGTLYGTTTYGGAFGSMCGISYNCGTVFKLTPGGDTSPWKETVLHRFRGTDGAFPQAGVIFGSDGNLYGDTAGGGSQGNGTVFEIRP